MLNENSKIGKKYVDKKREANVQNCIYDWNSWVITDNVRCEAAGDQLSGLSARLSTSPAPRTSPGLGQEFLNPSNDILIQFELCSRNPKTMFKRRTSLLSQKSD